MTDSPQTQQPRRRHRWLSDLRLALMLLTRLPLPAGRSEAAPPSGGVARAVWIFPLIGVLAGLTGGGVFMIASSLGLGISSATLLAMGSQILLTGALHEDGLADMADGFGGGRSRERKLEIMRDSRIGTYGVIALVLALCLRFSALQELASNLLPISDEVDETISHNAAITVALVVSGTLSRAAMAMAWYLLPAARSDGLAASSGTVPFGAAMAAVLLAVAIAILLLPGLGFVIVCATVAVLTLVVALIAYWQIRGHTGDVLGATQQVTEIGALLAISITTLVV
ncbi:adenosylcobinamide-GDP ribazoletransferase [Ferrovibrio terrae]|uniref:adenosylcobinamide-GDP ribazoletransferase n=1 Tax=Ferrovibrio terrae TaxID=2594003 RepID=UPI0031378FE6